MIHDIKLPPEGPVPLVSLSQLLRHNTTDWFELYQGRAKRIKCRSLIYDLNAVSVRGDDHEDLLVERLPLAPGSRQHHERIQHFAQFGAFAARDLPACTICASYSRGAKMTPTEEVPGGGDGPGGVLVCPENFIIYKNQDHQDVRAIIPRRSDLPGD